MIDEPTEGDTSIDEGSESQKEPVTPPPPMDGNGKTETISESVRKAREVIPMGDRGVTPQTYAQWIDIAKDVCKAYLMLPEHLHNNPQVVAGLLEIAARFNLSPYMLASKTYIQNNRLCFESQAFGAILYASRMLLGRLRYEFNGEGEEMTCTVSGRFRDDPDFVCSATTPPLKQLHPGRVTKGDKTFVKGSPLWDKDPEQQVAYFGQRRWIRRFAPDAAMGMYTREEIEELDEYRAERAGGIPLTVDRLGRLDTGEGWREGNHVDLDLATLKPEQPESEVFNADEIEFSAHDAEPEPKKVEKPPRAARHKPAQARKAVARERRAPEPKKRSRGGRVPSRVEVQAAVRRAEKPPRRPAPPPPKWLDYVQRADAWIGAATDPVAAETRWDRERDERDDLQVPMGERSRLRAILDRKIEAAKPKDEKE